MRQLQTIRVLVVDDHPLARSGLQSFLLGYEDMELVGEAKNGLEAVEFCQNHEVDVVLMDMAMPLMDGSEATRRITGLGKPVKVVVLTSFHEKELVRGALEAGATSYLLKDVDADELATAVRSAVGGFSVLATEAAHDLMDSALQKPTKEFNLTERELEVLALVKEGESNLEIAADLNISLPTVKYHIKHVFQKLGAKSRGEAVAIALKNKLIRTP